MLHVEHLELVTRGESDRGDGERGEVQSDTQCGVPVDRLAEEDAQVRRKRCSPVADHSLFVIDSLSLKALSIDPSGRLVNYRQLRSTNIFDDLCVLTKHLTSITLDNVTENERKTFFISKCQR